MSKKTTSNKGETRETSDSCVPGLTWVALVLGVAGGAGGAGAHGALVMHAAQCSGRARGGAWAEALTALAPLVGPAVPVGAASLACAPCGPVCGPARNWHCR